jgi:hypothetical protein
MVLLILELTGNGAPSFDSQSAYAPKSLPILLYCHESMLANLEDLGEFEDDDSV